MFLFFSFQIDSSALQKHLYERGIAILCGSQGTSCGQKKFGSVVLIRENGYSSGLSEQGIDYMNTHANFRDIIKHWTNLDPTPNI